MVSGSVQGLSINFSKAFGVTYRQMAMPKEDSEVIDLTGSSPITSRQFVDLTLRDDRNDDPVTTPSDIQNPTSSSVKRKRRSKKKKSRSGTNSQTNTANSTRAPSTEENSPDKHDSAQASQPSVPQPCPCRPSPAPESGTSQIFYIDTCPDSIPPLVDHFGKPQELERQSAPSTSELLLPPHVHIFGSEPSSILVPSQKELDEEDYIEYLDYDEHKDVPRYFEESSKVDTRPSKLVCKNCGADHKTFACTVVVCLTCGAHNEHSTRSCPISKVCFTCGMKGHINATCPNRYTAQAKDLDKYSECERCHSTLHQTNECPSWWRLYEYITDEERARVIASREQKKLLALGDGVQEHISDDPWCYNCGSIGHWGDDCDEAPHRYDRPEEPSAFSLYNIQSGPFYDPTEPTVPAKQNGSYRNINDDAWAKDMPSEVGLQGRRKNIAKLEKRARELEQGNDDDWFGQPAGLRIRGEAKRGTVAENGSQRQSKMSFGNFSNARKRFGFENSKPPSLLSRLSREDKNGDDPRDKDDRNEGRHEAYDIDSRNRWNGRSRRERDRDYDWDRDRDKDRQRNRPRYRGSYMR